MGTFVWREATDHRIPRIRKYPNGKHCIQHGTEIELSKKFYDAGEKISRIMAFHILVYYKKFQERRQIFVSLR